MYGRLLNSVSRRALIGIAGAAIIGTPAYAADLGGNCCADLEERVAELEATTARKGNRKVSLQVWGRVSEAIVWWNDGAEKNTYVGENTSDGNRLGFRGSAKINSDWSAGYAFEVQVRAYRLSTTNQLALGASNNVQIATYNTQSIALREANWYLRSETYGTITVGRAPDATVGASTVNLGNPSGFNGPATPNGWNGMFLRRAGTVGNQGLSNLTWGGFANIRNGDGPYGVDTSNNSSQIKYTSPFFLGQSKTSGFRFDATWGMDDVWGVGLRYGEQFGQFRFAAAGGYLVRDLGSNGCSTGASGNNATAGANAVLASTDPLRDLGSTTKCDAVTFSASIMHVPTGLYLSGGKGAYTDHMANQAALARSSGNQGGTNGEHSATWVQAGWQAKLNSLGNTTFWGQYVEFDHGVGVQNTFVQSVASTDVLNSLGATAIIRSSQSRIWGGGITQDITAAAMRLHFGYQTQSTSGVLGSTTSTARASTRPIDDIQIFYSGATISF